MPAKIDIKDIFTIPQDNPPGGLIFHEDPKTSFNELFVTGAHHGWALGVYHQSIITASTDLDLILNLLEQRQTDQQRIELLERQVAELQEAFGLSQIEPRMVTEAEARDEIMSYFAEHHGETVYPSDVAADLKLDYSLVSNLITELESDGEIKKV